MNLPYIDVANPSRGSHRAERQVAQLIATPIALFVICLFYLLKLLAKGLYKAKRWLWRISIFCLIFFVAGSNLTLTVSSPKAEAALDHMVIVTPTPKAPTQEDIILSKRHGDIMLRIMDLESSGGKNGRIECSDKGELNTMGFDVADHRCFTSLDEELDVVSQWLDVELASHPLNEVLCLYNLGIDEPTCTYEKDFMGI